MYKNIFKNSFFNYSLLFFYSLVLSTGLSKFIVNVKATEMIYFRVLYESGLSYTVIAFLTFITAFGLLFFDMKYKAGLVKANLPCLLILPLLFFDTSFLTINLFLIITTICFYRSLVACNMPYKTSSVNKTIFNSIIITLTVLFILSGIYAQIIAYKTLFLGYSDWAIFLKVADSTIKGNFFYSNWENANFLSVHFMPTSFSILVPAVGLFHHQYIIFIINSITLWSSGILLYIFMRKNKIPTIYSAMIAVSYLLSPTIFNMNISLFYGFHCIYFFIPIFILFNYFHALKRYKIAFAIFIISLGIKETVAIFWIGWALVNFYQNRDKRSIIYLLISCFYFLMLTQLIMPYMRGGNYAFSRLFSHLGNNVLEIALSPLTRPTVFWGCLFRTKNLYYLLALLVPSFIITFSRPVYLLAVLPQLLFVILFADPEMVNNCSQYQTEAFALISVNMAYAAIMLKKGETSRWWGILLCGMPCDNMKYRQKLLFSASACVLLSTMLYHYLFAFTPWGQYSFTTISNRPDCTAPVGAIKEIIPKGASVGATERLAAHLVLGYNVFKVYTPGMEYYVFDMSDKMQNYKKRFSDILSDKEYGLVWMKLYKGHCFFIFKHNAKPKFNHGVSSFTEDQWAKAGNSLKLPRMSRDFACKIRFSRENNIIIAHCFLKVIKPVDYNVDISIHAEYHKKNRYWKVPFGYMIKPASLALPGDVFYFQIPIPKDWNGLSVFGLKLVNSQ